MFTIFCLKIALAFAGFLSQLLWTGLAAVVPDLPEQVKVIFEVVLDLAAELGFLALMLGSTWARQREQFVRWTSGELEEE